MMGSPCLGNKLTIISLPLSHIHILDIYCWCISLWSLSEHLIVTCNRVTRQAHPCDSRLSIDRRSWTPRYPAKLKHFLLSEVRFRASMWIVPMELFPRDFYGHSRACPALGNLRGATSSPPTVSTTLCSLSLTVSTLFFTYPPCSLIEYITYIYHWVCIDE